MPENAEQDKASHGEVKYEYPAEGNDHCSICDHFIRSVPFRCKLVKQPIHAGGWCVKFE